MEYPDFYGRICQAQGRLEQSELIVLHDDANMLRFCASPQPTSRTMFLTLQLYKFTDTRLQPKIKCLWHKEICDIMNSNEDFMQFKLLSLLSYMFLGLFLDFPRMENKFSASDMEESGIVGSTNYIGIFNLLSSLMCSFFFSTYKARGYHLDRKGEFSNLLAKEREEIMLLIEPSQSHRFMTFLASMRPHNDERALTISYSSSVGGFWRIASYSPLVSLEKTRESRIWKLNSSDRFSLLNFIFQFRSVVNVSQSCTEVHLQLDNVTCDVLPYKEIRVSTSNIDRIEKHFPAKICLRIGPDNGQHGVQSVSLGVSSANPVTDIGEGNTLEASLQNPNNMGIKFTSSTTWIRRIKNWGFELSPVNGTDAKMDWTLYDGNTGKPIWNNVPSKSPFRSHKTPSFNGALTEQGGVVFAKDDYGKPITWRLNRNLQGETLRWIIEASIWLTYKPNTRYSETVRHDFRQEVDLKLNTTELGEFFR